MSQGLNKFIRVSIKLMKDAERFERQSQKEELRAYKQHQREQLKREKEAYKAHVHLQKEQTKRQKEELKMALDKEKDCFEARVKQRKALRLGVISKIKKG